MGFKPIDFLAIKGNSLVYTKKKLSSEVRLNDLVLFGILVMSLIKIIALIINVNVYLDSKDKRYTLYISGWSIYLISGLMPIISIFFVDPIITNILLLINAVLSSIAFVNVAGGYYSQFININFKWIPIIIVVFTTTVIVLYLAFGLNIAMNIAIFNLNALLIVSFILPVIKWKLFKINVGRSIIWYYITVLSLLIYVVVSIYITSLGYSFGVYDCNDPVIIFWNYFTGIVVLSLLINYFYQFEYCLLARKKDNLIGEYSHNIGNALQSIYLSTEVLRTKKESSEEEKKEMADLIDKKLNTALKFLKEIREL